MPKCIFRGVLATSQHTELFIVSSGCVFYLILHQIAYKMSNNFRKFSEAKRSFKHPALAAFLF